MCSPKSVTSLWLWSRKLKFNHRAYLNPYLHNHSQKNRVAKQKLNRSPLLIKLTL